MDLDQFETTIEDLSDRLAGSNGGEDCPSISGPDPTGGCSALLKLAIDQLRAARTRLRDQEEEIRIARLISEAERQRYRDLFDEAPVGYVVTNPSGRIEEANRAAITLLGRHNGDLIGRSLIDSIAESGREAFRLGLDRLASQGHLADCEARISPVDGEESPVVFRAAAVPDWSANPLAFRWIIRESTSPGMSTEPGQRTLNGAGRGERATVHPIRPASSAVAARILDELDFIFWEARWDGQLRYINDRIETLLGYPARHWIEGAGTWTSIVHPDDRDWVDAHRRRSFDQGLGGELEYRLIASDGRVLWFRETTRVALDELGQIESVRGALWNIARRKKVERHLHAMRRELADQLADLSYLRELIRRLWARREIGPLLGEILVAALSIEGAEIGYIRASDAAGGKSEIVANQGLPAEFIERYGFREDREPSNGRGGRHIVEDVEEDARSTDADREAARLGGYRAFHETPLIDRRGISHGTIVLCFQGPHRPVERQILLVEKFARDAGDFIENAGRTR